MAGEIYDRIGANYRRFRQPDLRIAELIHDALGGCSSVVNVGAGAGSYEPVDRPVVAVEPSRTMIAQRPPGTADVVQASAGALPFRDRSFDAALAILTMHHWPSWQHGTRELARVARARIVLLTWDPGARGFWLIDEYFPEIIDIDRAIFPTLAELQVELRDMVVRPVPIPHDCTDGFMCAYWRRPRAYLDPEIRSAISTFAKLADVDARLRRLEADLDSGAWQRRHRDLLRRDSIELGYRLVIASPGS